MANNKPTYEQLANYWEENNTKNGSCITSHVSGIGNITNRIYNTPHTFLDESYDIRKGWYNPTFSNSYLIPHAKEESDNYNVRKSSSVYKNYLKQIVNTLVDPLFKGAFEFDVLANQLTFKVAAENFIKKFNIKLFLMETMKSFELHDMTYTVVEPRTKDSIEINGKLPVVYNVKIENVRSDTKVNYTDKFTEIVYRMDKIFIDKDKNIRVPYFTETEYKQDSFITTTELYRDKEGCYYNGDNKPKDANDLIRLDINDVMISDFYYETLPVIEFKSKIDTTRDTTPEMHDLAIACWEYYNTASLHKELERKGPFPMLTVQATGQVDNLRIGVNNALIYQEDMDAPKYLEVETKLHAEFRASKADIRQDIYKLFLQGLQTEETKFTSEDSNEISESLFFNKVNFLSEYLKDYTIKLFANVIYVVSDGKTDIETLTTLSKEIEMRFNFDFDMNREVRDIAYWNLLAELTQDSENMVIRNKLIEAVAEKIDVIKTDKKPLQE